MSDPMRFRYPLALRITLGLGAFFFAALAILSAVAAGDEPTLQIVLTAGFGLAAILNALLLHICQRSYSVSDDRVEEFSWGAVRKSLPWDRIHEVQERSMLIHLTGRLPEESITVPSMIAGYTELRKRILRRAPPPRKKDATEFRVLRAIIVGRVVFMIVVPAVGFAVCVALWHWSAFIVATVAIVGTRNALRTVRELLLHDHGLEVRRVLGREVLPWSEIGGVAEQSVQLNSAYGIAKTGEMINSLEIRLLSGRNIKILRSTDGVWSMKEAIQKRIGQHHKEQGED